MSAFRNPSAGDAQVARELGEKDVHSLGAAGDPSTLLHAVELAVAGVLGLALHVVIVVVAASCADEKGRRQQRRRAGADLLDGRDAVRERRGVDEDALGEPAVAMRVSVWLEVCAHASGWPNCAASGP